MCRCGGDSNVFIAVDIWESPLKRALCCRSTCLCVCACVRACVCVFVRVCIHVCGLSNLVNLLNPLFVVRVTARVGGRSGYVHSELILSVGQIKI